jgi:hypothetical protein
MQDSELRNNSLQKYLKRVQDLFLCKALLYRAVQLAHQPFTWAHMQHQLTSAHLHALHQKHPAVRPQNIIPLDPKEFSLYTQSILPLPPKHPPFKSKASCL